MLAPPRSAFEKSAAARAASMSASAREEADAMETGEAGAMTLPASNSLLSVSSAESWKTALSTARCAFLNQAVSMQAHCFQTSI